MRIFIALITLFLSFSQFANGQNAFGALNSNYMPTNSLYVNPSSILDAKVWLDINIVGAGAYVNNDFVYLQNHSGISATRSAIQSSGYGADASNAITDDDIGYNQSRKKYHAYARVFATAPSVVWSQGDHAAGLSIGGRSYTGIRKMPDYIAQFIENGVQDYTTQHDINYTANNIHFASLNFAELKLTYAHTFLKKRKDMFMAGVTFNKFFSFAGAALNVHNFDFLVDNDTVTDVFNLEADAMYAMGGQFNLNAKGGWGMDFGFTWQKMLRDASSYYPNSPRMGCTDIPYKWKLGVSIIDVGNVKFDPYFYAGYDFDDYNWLFYADDEINEDNPTDLFEAQEPAISTGQVKHPHKIRLPTFISAQFDYNVWASRFYVNATIIQGMPVSKRKFGIRHANNLTVTPRFEHYWFEFALPMGMYEYKYPQLGATMRLGPITIGTDKLINWLFKKDIYGADIYFYLKMPIQYHPSCKDRMKSSRRRSKDRSTTKCTI